MINNSFITSPESLVTTHEQTRAGFLSIALEKNKVGDPYVKNALAFKAMVAHTTSPDEFIGMKRIRPFLLTASGLSDKSMQYLTEEDQTAAIVELIEKFLKPAGKDYVDEATFRYLLIKGDAVGGTMRNKIGALGQEKLIRAIFSSMDVRGIQAEWISNAQAANEWNIKRVGESEIESQVKAIHWKNDNGDRILAFNMTVPTVKKNVDICLYACPASGYNKGKFVANPSNAIMLGELKGGIDPAGADEHWKTGNSALARIRSAFDNAGYAGIKTSFIGAAIASAMAVEIYEQLDSGILTNAANLTDTNQLVEYCNWMIEL